MQYYSIIHKTGCYSYLSSILIMKMKPSNTPNENVLKDVLTVCGEGDKHEMHEHYITH